MKSQSPAAKNKPGKGKTTAQSSSPNAGAVKRPGASVTLSKSPHKRAKAEPEEGVMTLAQGTRLVQLKTNPDGHLLPQLTLVANSGVRTETFAELCADTDFKMFGNNDRRGSRLYALRAQYEAAVEGVRQEALVRGIRLVQATNLSFCDAGTRADAVFIAGDTEEESHSWQVFAAGLYFLRYEDPVRNWDRVSGNGFSISDEDITWLRRQGFEVCDAT